MKVIDTREYVSVLKQLTDEGREVSMRIAGNSMAPFLIHERDTIFFRKPEAKTIENGVNNVNTISSESRPDSVLFIILQLPLRDLNFVPQRLANPDRIFCAQCLKIQLQLFCCQDVSNAVFHLLISHDLFLVFFRYFQQIIPLLRFNYF